VHIMKRLGHQNAASPAPERVSGSLRQTFLVGAAIIVLTFGGFGGWAATAPLSSAVVAEGVLKIASERKSIQHPEGGVVREILVKDGSRVRKGDVLLRLDDVKARATLDTLRIQLDAAQARRARLIAEKQILPDVVFRPDLVERSAENPAIAELLKGEADVFSTRRNTFDSEVSMVSQKMIQIEKQIEGEQVQSVAKEKEMGLLREELSGLKVLFKKGFVAKPRLVNIELDIARLEGEAGQHRAETARLRTAIAELQIQILQQRQGFIEKVVAELREIDDQIANFETKIRDAAHTTRNTVIEAPEDGVVMGLTAHTQGGVVKPGGTILELVPGDGALIVEARVAPKDVESLSPGQAAHVRLTAFRQRVTPIVETHVSYVSADRFTDERTQASYYIVRAALTPESLAVLGGRALQPGMPAEVIIEATERTALAYLMQPVLDGFSRTWREE